MTRRTALGLVVGLVLAIAALVPTTAGAWAPAASATIKPGNMTYTEGAQCTSNFVFRDAAEVRLPRTSRELNAMQGPRIAPERLAAADLVFFGSGGTVTHVGIYVGEGRFVHAPSSGGTVRLDHLDAAWWSSRYTGSRRVLR